VLSKQRAGGAAGGLHQAEDAPLAPAITQHSALSTQYSSRAARWFLLVWLAAALIGLALAVQPAHPLADVTHYKLWTRLVTTEGVAAIYSGEYPDGYVIYPPVTMYGLSIIGHLYQALVDPTFDREQALASHWLTVAIRLMALSVHLVAGGVLFALLGRGAARGAAVIGAGLYLLNPGALWDVAVWGQPNSWHSLFSLLGIWLVGRCSFLAGGAWLGLAALTKPQAWALLPLAAVAVVRESGRAGERESGRKSAHVFIAALQAAGGAGAVGLVVLLPFLASGHLRQVLTLPGHVSSVMPVASANAHNLWWLVSRGEVPFVLDSERLPGPLPLSYRQAALLLVVVALGFSLWRTWLARGPWELAALAAFSGHAWFCLTTAAHENHAFIVFPFLCLVWWRSRFLAAVLVLLIGTFSFNVIVHDFGLEPLFDAALGRWSWRLQMAASSLNLTILAGWTVWLLRPDGGPAGPPERAFSA
jgi:hypothetical protein